MEFVLKYRENLEKQNTLAWLEFRPMYFKVHYHWHG